MRKILLLISTIALTSQFVNGQSSQKSGNGRVELSGSIGPTFGGDKGTYFYGNAELNFFMSGNMALTAGYEYLTDKHSLILGNRIYVVPEFHFSMKGVLVNQTDFALGGGYTHGLNDGMNLQVNGDYYFSRRMFTLSFGVGFRL
ncbi:hypothetical protein [Flammeovirga kamogawensis]|uniref:Outer membrane protein beta-barrel domain-containing protein n=1 Tax=Flammeovirga kamogawensis TaxID=373891 RepID=A0ABX8GVT6_9BACT|nr:hypothetical protein [Flammeovirga kamogawensis]MBB6461144.1 hypothetical protein [Flammeovirga kamogawensis]QWG07710.1 hypothetical protein KM029_01870 [Flammeovirga kamogawensis]TRX69517.1 hypothetical protein EO216_15805 [Flammeovirga kamogawensis]